MKKIYTISVIVLVIAILTFGVLGYRNFERYTQTRPINIEKITVNGMPISYRSYDITHSFLNGAIKKQRTYYDTKDILQQIELKGNQLVVDQNVQLTISESDSNKQVFQGTSQELQQFVFSTQGDYLVHATQNYQDTYGVGVVDYEFAVIVKENPQIKISNEKPKQGELVKLDISGVFSNTKLSLEGEFLPSHSYYNPKGIMELYIPITYYKPAKEYEMKLQVGDTTIPFTLDVQKENFTQLHFTVDSSVADSTVNSADANIEYRNKIHPLYKTMDSNKYWEGAFIKPINEKRISSTFGQERYVNNSKTPTRHAGIDYAAPEGTEVYATNHGKVEFAEFLQLTGNTIVIDHGLGLKSYHFHLSAIDVKAGDMVQKGQLIGKVGTTGYSTGPHLHFQISIQNQPINPELLYQIAF